MTTDKPDATPRPDVEGLKAELYREIPMGWNGSHVEIERYNDLVSDVIDHLAASGHLNTAPAPAKEYHLSSGEQAVCRNALRKSVKIKPAPSKDRQRALDALKPFFTGKISVFKMADIMREHIGTIRTALSTDTAELAALREAVRDLADALQFIKTATPGYDCKQYGVIEKHAATIERVREG